MYYLGRGVEQDYDKAFLYYSTIDKHKQHPIAWLMLGRMYLAGHGVEKDLVRARNYLRKAAERGYVFGYAYLYVLERELGNACKAWLLKWKAAILTIRLKLVNGEDIRLRSS